MTELAIDYAWAHPTPAAITEAGYTTVLRYLSSDPSKDLSGPEATALHAAGLKIGLVWETTAQRALGGGTAGAQDALLAVELCRALGYPKGCVVFGNIGDWAATLEQMPAVASYYASFAGGVGAAGFEPGGYGTGYVIDYLANAGWKGYWWQNAMNDEGDSGSQVSVHASVYQRVSPTKQIANTPTSSYDEDVLLNPIPTWGKAIVPPKPPTPVPVPPPVKGDNMAVLTSNVATDGKGNGWTDIPLYGATSMGIAGVLCANPGTPAAQPDGERYDMAQANVAIGGVPGSVKVQVVNGSPNSTYGVYLLVT